MGTPIGELGWILDELPMAVWVGSVPSGVVAYANKEFERILAMPPVDSSHIEDVPQTYGVVDREGKPYPTDQLPFSRVVATGAATVVSDIIVRRPQGDTNIRAFGAPVWRADGTMSHVIVTFFDITAEVAAERQRRTVEQRLSFVCDNAPIVIWATDAEGTITLSEGAGLASLGIKPGQLVGSNVFALYGTNPAIPAYIRRGLAGESFGYTAGDGQAVYQTWLTPLRDEAGKVVGLVALSNDVSELRKLQNTALQNDRVNALGTLAASMAHEINNPLTYVLAHGDAVNAELDVLDGILSDLNDPRVPAARASVARVREDLAPVRSGISRIATITRDLRTFSRPDEATLAPVDVHAVVDAVLKLVRKEVEARAQLVLDLKDTPSVLGNEARLVQVILNLMFNALQALPVDAPVRHRIGIRTYTGGSLVVIEIGDSGPGVPPADRERIFEPFYTTKEIGIGTGLGLFVCRSVVRGLSGDVIVGDSEWGGALFRVTLPATAATQPAAAPVAVAAPAARRRHVVIIDDDVLVLRALSTKLTRAGFRVTAIGSASAGLDLLLTASDIDLVYCDLMMTGMTGMELADTLERKAPGTARKMVFMTGGAFSPVAQDFVIKHRGHTVDKPFDIVGETDRRLGADGSSGA
ncbi:MAG TPA: ATP-binding protein [Polyangia bacterium]|nr:ATP-binding protein [Polyangia bacterium]